MRPKRLKNGYICLHNCVYIKISIIYKKWFSGPILLAITRFLMYSIEAKSSYKCYIMFIVVSLFYICFGLDYGKVVLL